MTEKQIKFNDKYKITDELSLDLIRATRQTRDGQKTAEHDDGTGIGHICGYNFVFRFHGSRTVEAFISDSNMGVMGINDAIRNAFHIAIDEAFNSMDFNLVPLDVGKAGLINFKIVQEPKT